MIKLTKNNLFCTDLPTTPQPGMGTILVSGASGYIGGRLVPELLARGYRVRVMVRALSPEAEARWPEAEVFTADAMNKEAMVQALAGVHTAYYLIHSLLLGRKKFEAADIQAAANFREAAEINGVKRIIYLGGLGDTNAKLSAHLRSRMQVADELRISTVPVTVLRAAIIIGSGSASFEIIKNLVKNITILPCPKWAKTRCQPISIRDVVKYLVGVLELPESAGLSFDIGGPEILTYQDMLKILASVLGKKRLFFCLPFSLTRLYGYFVSLCTPVPAAITICLMGGCKNEVICKRRDINKLLHFRPLTYREAVVRALTREEQDAIHTRWSDAYPPAHSLAIKLHELKKEPRYLSSYSLYTNKQPSALFKNICKIGGQNGWFHSNLLWRLRGMIDRMLLGVGTSRGRRSSADLRVNDVIDFWRVEELEQDRMLLLRAEMKLPGKAWLRFTIEKKEAKEKKSTNNLFSVTAFFDTRSLLGIIYWYILLPFHRYIFYDLIHQIEKRS